MGPKGEHFKTIVSTLASQDQVNEVLGKNGIPYNGNLFSGDPRAKTGEG
jgi:hypothetical protein